MNNRETVGPFQFRYGRLNSRDKIQSTRQKVVDQMSNGFGVCF